MKKLILAACLGFAAIGTMTVSATVLTGCPTGGEGEGEGEGEDDGGAADAG